MIYFFIFQISYAERQERDRHLEQISTLTSQLGTMTDKCNRLSLELEVIRSENTNIKKQLHETTERLDATKIQHSSLNAEKAHATNLLTDKKSEMERLRQEKEYYANLLDQKNEELTQVRTQKERLCIQLEEKDKNLLLLQQHSNNFTQVNKLYYLIRELYYPYYNSSQKNDTSKIVKQNRK